MRKVILLLCGFLVAASAAWAHHSYGATYNSKKEIKLEGTLVQFVYRNPHSFVHVTAPDDTGAMQRWAVEWSGTSQLANSGVTARVAQGRRPGRITARPSRVTTEYRALMVRLVRPTDGFSWGSRGGEVVD